MQDLNSYLCFSSHGNIKIIPKFSGVKQSFITLMDQEFGQDTVSIASLCSLMSGARLEDGEVGYGRVANSPVWELIFAIGYGASVLLHIDLSMWSL